MQSDAQVQLSHGLAPEQRIFRVLQGRQLNE